MERNHSVQPHFFPLLDVLLLIIALILRYTLGDLKHELFAPQLKDYKTDMEKLGFCHGLFLTHSWTCTVMICSILPLYIFK